MAVRDAEPAAGTMLRGRGGTAHLERETVQLDRAGIRLVIPLDAIRTVLVARGRRTSAEIRLNSAVARAEPATVCAISSRSAEEVEAFARAVNAALPQRDKAERRIDGAALVTAKESPWTPRTRPRAFLSSAQWWALSTLTCLFTLGLLLPVSAGDGRLAQFWTGTFPMLVYGCFLARGTWRATVTWWLLHRYGVTTVARCAGYSPPGDPALSGTVVYAFTDTSGTSHTFERAGGPSASDKWISYDPARPDFARGPGQPSARTLILLIRLLVGVPVMLAMAAYLVWYFTTAMHAEIADLPDCFHRDW
ncbi:hypothetical protein OG819_34995 [Streptomyces sp. NBC_01549]|uniref:hypothetical protein n=1 Tax=Streptomyces sp. NBC_01549 TaxID=2975874 RepID=UPI00224CAAE5|nr:hypothetical protein [Streptomyces sp. NBC_01549]MCX4594730.1 hypothetical protein [Streptomyces sp. NBC_01549]